MSQQLFDFAPEPEPESPHEKRQTEEDRTQEKRTALVAQIIRDQRTLNENLDDCAGPGREFYEQRIAMYKEAVNEQS